MTKRNLWFMCCLLIVLAVPAICMRAAPQNQNGPNIQKATNELEDKLMGLATQPFEWSHHGNLAYHQPCHTKEDIADFFKKNRESIVADLTDPKKSAFPKDLAEFIIEEFSKANKTDSKIEKGVLNVGDRFTGMIFKNGAVRYGIVMGKSEPAWELPIPERFKEYAQKTIALPLVCCNITIKLPATFSALGVTETVTEIKKTSQTVEVEKETSKPANINIYDQRQYNTINIRARTENNNVQLGQGGLLVKLPDEHGASCGRKCKIILGVVGAVGTGAVVYIKTRGGHSITPPIPPFTPDKPIGGGGGVN